MNLLNICIINSCNLSCYYCPMKDWLRPFDTREQTFDDIERGWGLVNQLTNEALLKWLDHYLSPSDWYIEITGGEPGLYPEINDLLESLTDRGYHGLVKTNGTLPIVKTKNFQLITSWHQDKPFPELYDQILIIKNPKDDWRAKVKYCEENGIPYKTTLFDATNGRKSLDPIFCKYNKMKNILHINNIGQIVSCPKKFPEEYPSGYPRNGYDIFNMAPPTPLNLSQCPKCKLVNDVEMFMPKEIYDLL